MRSRHQDGQAAVESVGITVLVALLVAATALVLLRDAHPPAAPPPVIERVARPLGAGYDRGLWSGAPSAAYRGLSAQTRGDRPIGRALRAVGRGIAAAVALEQEAEGEFHVGARARLRERARALLDDPLGGLTTLPDPSALSPTAIALRPVAHAGELWDYAQYVRTLPPRQAMRVVARDAGASGTDVLIDVVEAYVRKRIARAVARRYPPPPGGGGVARTP